MKGLLMMTFRESYPFQASHAVVLAPEIGAFVTSK